jgi:pheophorbide a oxygenase
VLLLLVLLLLPLLLVLLLLLLLSSCKCIGAVACSCVYRWVVFEDRCPHRLAPLSEGRIIQPAAAAATAAAAGGGGSSGSSGGGLMCSYHGWTFNPSGTCTAIPQLQPAAAATACGTRRTCATAYPCQVGTGLGFGG